MRNRQTHPAQSPPVTPKRGGTVPRWWCGSNAILVMMTAVLAIVATLEILRG
ncbi:hypothetical protein [Neorhizobium sp. IRS_2294]|uniref:hypothetical protein n=1 Tax=unclassified Neorhizobium TaxID=2629175 RepID=UPI003D27B118